jgi:peroxiredoxin
VRVARAAAVVGVVALAGLLVWRLTHQPKTIAAAVSKGAVVRAPAFRLKPLTGAGSVSLAAYRGKAVVLNFWGSWCGPCKEELPRLEAAAERWSGRPVAVVGVDVLDSRGAARAFVSKHHVTYRIGFDPLGDTVNAYAVHDTPTTFFVDRRGRIVHRILGPVTNGDLDAQIRAALAS